MIITIYSPQRVLMGGDFKIESEKNFIAWNDEWFSSRFCCDQISSFKPCITLIHTRMYIHIYTYVYG